METSYAIILFCFAIFFYILITIMRKMAKLKEQNDRIYEDTYTKENTYPVRLEDKEKSVYYEDYNILMDLDISIRTKNCLNAAEIIYLEELIYYTKQELLNFRHFGKKSLEELENLMNEHNLKFKENGK